MTINVDMDPPYVRRAPESVRLMRQLVAGVGNYQMRRATIALGLFRDGYWLRRFVEDPALSGAVKPEGQPTWVDWDRVAELLETPELLDDDDLEPGTMGPHLAVLEIAASLGGGRPVDLKHAARVLPAAEWRRLQEVMAPAADRA